ncbi:MAG TPA: rod shape-determining protein MreC [Gemmatimonadales bacterium]|nr:rod shape-determining protein MreC [Gemmatimonadales bacterium]
MPRSLERPEQRRDTWLFALCLGLSTLALFLPARWGQKIAAGLRSTALAPLVWLQDRGAEGRTSRTRFRAVSAQRDSMAQFAFDLPEIKAENDRLRALLALGERIGPGFLSAEVLRQTLPTEGRTLLLNRGAADGVTPFSPVVSPEGLVGVVREVDERTSIAMTWAHPEFRVSAVSETGEIAGIAAPTAVGDASRTTLEFRAITYRDTLPDGALVVASGLGGVYPRGLPVGTVAGVEREQMGWERVYRLRPLAQPSAVSHVLILQGAEPLRISAAFAEAARAAKAAAAAKAPPEQAVPAPSPAVAESTTAMPPAGGAPAATVRPPDSTAPPRPRRPRPRVDSAPAPVAETPPAAEPSPTTVPEPPRPDSAP